jgi:DNA-binding winged helix-turn-helix (wHTH) protein
MHKSYEFADLRLDTGQRRIWRGDAVLPLTRQTFALLEMLVEQAPNLVTHAAITDRVWGPRRIVTPENLSQHLRMLRRALGDDAAKPA